MTTMFPSLTDADRAVAIDRLRAIPATELRAVLKKLQGTGRRGKKTIEWIVAETEGSGHRLNSRVPEERLPEFMVDVAGVDLLAIREVRLRLARHASPDQLDLLHSYPSVNRGRGGPDSQARAIADRNWHPGKGWARHFARSLGLPMVFAGLAGSPSEPAVEHVEPFRPLQPLEDFQEELKMKALAVLTGPSGNNRGILTLPTGAGKTRTAVEALVQRIVDSDGRLTVLWIAQSEELCEQAVLAFREVWTDLGHRDAGVRAPLTIQRLWSTRRLDEFGPGVIVASIQKLERLTEDGEAAGTLIALASTLGGIVIDEAHRMLAPSYAQVLRGLGIETSKPASIPILGLTATPYRTRDEETARLAARFGHHLLEAGCLGEEPEAVLLHRGVLARAVHEVLAHGGAPIKVAGDRYFETFRDLSPRMLQDIGQDRERNRRIFQKLMEFPADWPVLFFGCSVDHARAISVLLRKNGRPSASVVSDTPPATRRFLIEEFREGRLSVLSNYGVLTTGFDAPAVRALIVARPTASIVLYQQMIGRGLRGPRFGGTEECLVVDVDDNVDVAEALAYRRFKGYWSQARAPTAARLSE